MKINEKNLTAFAITPPVDLEGYLSKRGEVNKSWQKRWFVLKGNLLFYFERKGDREPLGVIILEGCTIELAEEGEQYCFQIAFHGINNRTYMLSADTQELMEQWMKALTCAGYEYMKIMVAELQRQLEEIENNQKNKQDNIETPKPPPRRQNPFNRPAPAPPSNDISASITSKLVDKSELNGSYFVPVGFEATEALTKASEELNEFTFDSVHEGFRRAIEYDLSRRKKTSNNNDIGQVMVTVDRGLIL